MKEGQAYNTSNEITVGHNPSLSIIKLVGVNMNGINWVFHIIHLIIITNDKHFKIVNTRYNTILSFFYLYIYVLVCRKYFFMVGASSPIKLVLIIFHFEYTFWRIEKMLQVHAT